MTPEAARPAHPPLTSKPGPGGRATRRSPSTTVPPLPAVRHSARPGHNPSPTRRARPWAARRTRSATRGRTVAVSRSAAWSTTGGAGTTSVTPIRTAPRGGRASAARRPRTPARTLAPPQATACSTPTAARAASALPRWAATSTRCLGGSATATTATLPPTRASMTRIAPPSTPEMAVTSRRSAGTTGRNGRATLRSAARPDPSSLTRQGYSGFWMSRPSPFKVTEPDREAPREEAEINRQDAKTRRSKKTKRDSAITRFFLILRSCTLASLRLGGLIPDLPADCGSVVRFMKRSAGAPPM